MVSQAPMTQHALSHSEPKVHSGFHAAWDLSGLKAAVTKLIADNISTENASRMTVFLTGVCLCLRTEGFPCFFGQGGPAQGAAQLLPVNTVRKNKAYEYIDKCTSPLVLTSMHTRLKNRIRK